MKMACHHLEHLQQNYTYGKTSYQYLESCMGIAEKLNTPEKALKDMEKDLYPNVHVLLLLAATIPVTSCTVNVKGLSVC